MPSESFPAQGIDESEYCRQIEAYLCRKNEGHLIRIAGPVFEQVCGWAQLGVPLKVALRGIDRYCERYYAKGPKRRPVRIEFCEADILELFDDWRRAIGAGAGREEPRASRRPGLAAHIERVVSRLVGRGQDGGRSAVFQAALDSLVEALDRVAAESAHARGDRRARIILRLAELDHDLVRAAEAEVEPEAATALRREAEEELAGFGSRLPAEARQRAAHAVYQRLLRESLRLPTISYE